MSSPTPSPRRPPGPSCRRYADWLARHADRAELLRRSLGCVVRGLRFPPEMERELHVWLEEQSVRTLARLVALNVEPRDDEAFNDWRRQAAREPDDSYVRCGVRRRDFL